MIDPARPAGFKDQQPWAGGIEARDAFPLLDTPNMFLGVSGDAHEDDDHTIEDNEEKS